MTPDNVTPINSDMSYADPDELFEAMRHHPSRHEVQMHVYSCDYCATEDPHIHHPSCPRNNK